MSQVAHQARAYPCFSSMKRLRVFLLPLGWDASPSQGYPPALSLLLPIYTPGWEEALWSWVKCLAQEHNTMSLVRAWTQTARSGVKCTDHEASAPPTGSKYWKLKLRVWSYSCMFFSFGNHLSICTKRMPFPPLHHPIHGFLLVFFFSLYFTRLIFLEITSLVISLKGLIPNFWQGWSSSWRIGQCCAD